jgi:hypothetical protein
MNVVGTPKIVCRVDCIRLFFLLLDVLCGIGGRLFLLVLLLCFAVFGWAFCFGLMGGTTVVVLYVIFLVLGGVYRVDIVSGIAS